MSGTSRATVGAIELAYQDEGQGTPLLLIMGIGAQLIHWPQALVDRFCGAGLRVIRYDNRDAGASSQVNAPPPPRWRALAGAMIGAAPTAPYTLSDMAADAVGLLDHLGLARAHVLGVSLGGMVAQHLALEHPSRVSSVSLLMTTPGGRRYLPQPHALRALLRPRGTDADTVARNFVEVMRVIGTPDGGHDAEEMLAVGRLAFARGGSPAGFARQFAAILASGSRRHRLPNVRVPTLVMHGTRDPLIPISAGQALASLIPNAWWVPLDGMGHDLAPRFLPHIAAATTARIQSLSSTAT